ncbi:MAG: transcription termination factor Rho [Planctomycetota bacterium]|nr:transcription termination factor Rho [Planctomycetota bacterium]
MNSHSPGPGRGRGNKGPSRKPNYRDGRPQNSQRQNRPHQSSQGFQGDGFRPPVEPAMDLPLPEDAVSLQGVLEIHPRGYGFLRNPAKDYVPQASDPVVASALIQRLKLREGLLLGGMCEAFRGSQPPRLLKLETIEGKNPDSFTQRNFDDLTAIDPHEWIKLETGNEPLTTRVMDLLTPIGKGQRGLIVAPPRTGKTILLQHIAQAVSINHPEMHLVVLLVDERPEEVTEMRRTIKGEVIASSSDRDSASHVRTAELVVERGRRLVEQGKQVFILLDSLTRLARAYNKNTANSGRIMSGGVDSKALIDTGSRMDEVIFQEFKGTGNMELVLDRKLADRRIFPAMDICQSGTRKEEKLLSPEVLKKVHVLRRMLVTMGPVEAMDILIKKLSKMTGNQAFLDSML